MRPLSHSPQVLTIHGTDDEVIPVADAQKFAQCIRTHQLQIVQGADHRFKNNPAAAQQAVKKAVEFLTSG